MFWMCVFVNWRCLNVVNTHNTVDFHSCEQKVDQQTQRSIKCAKRNFVQQQQQQKNASQWRDQNKPNDEMKLYAEAYRKKRKNKSGRDLERWEMAKDAAECMPWPGNKTKHQSLRSFWFWHNNYTLHYVCVFMCMWIWC